MQKFIPLQSCCLVAVRTNEVYRHVHGQGAWVTGLILNQAQCTGSIAQDAAPHQHAAIDCKKYKIRTCATIK
jgi:hypothetical protein